MFLHCPIRGRLNVPERAADGMTFTEEKRRIDCIRLLLDKGYPATHFKIETCLLRFGHKGRNSFRTDLAVLDAPADELPTDIDALKPHIRLIAEIKRENAQAKLAKETQVYPALGFLEDIASLAVYWDAVEQRLFYRTLDGTKTKTHETAIALLPAWGQAFQSRRLRYEDLQSMDLRQLFQRVEDTLHTDITDKSRRFEIMLQLLLIKLYDEHANGTSGQDMGVQDFSDAPVGDAEVLRQCEQLLKRGINYYGRYLPKRVPSRIRISGAMLRSLSSLLAPCLIMGSKRDVVQDFYMYFAKGIYKWDLAQYFTPCEVVDFIVALTNPRAGEQVKDPACGSGDFLISSLHHAKQTGQDLRESVWGVDNSENAVQVCVLNMVLNGDGKANIREDDSLAGLLKELDSYDVMLCNPPFGVKIKERRFEVLRQFSLGHEWSLSEGGWEQTEKVVRAQEAGILFAELCVRQAAPGGRIGIILPNGYLGNRSPRYVALREWLLRHVRLVAVMAFPRFTFKKSGADVSAAAVIMEKRETPLERARDSDGYPFYPGIVESVGWSVSVKGAERIFRRDPETGSLLTTADNEPVIDADFDRVLSGVRSSSVAGIFSWIAHGAKVPKDVSGGWSVGIDSVLSREDLSIDAKRWCERCWSVREQIEAVEHFALGDVVDVLPEEGRPDDNSGIYNYVELKDVSDGVLTPEEWRGWQLPDRAKHGVAKGDIFVGSVWGSVGKWFVAGGSCARLVVSNGFHRLRVKPGKDAYLVDIVAGLNSEAYRIQARSRATGSDGLAELSSEDLCEIVMPKVTDKKARSILKKVVDELLGGRSTTASVVANLSTRGKIRQPAVKTRRTHWVQV